MNSPHDLLIALLLLAVLVGGVLAVAAGVYAIVSVVRLWWYRRRLRHRKFDRRA